MTAMTHIRAKITPWDDPAFVRAFEGARDSTAQRGARRRAQGGGARAAAAPRSGLPVRHGGGGPERPGRDGAHLALDRLARRLAAGRRHGAGGSCGQPASSLARMQSKVWPIILLAVPSIIRAPTDASVPADRDVGRPVHRRWRPRSAPTSAMSAVASTADPGAWPWALMMRAVRLRSLGDRHVHREPGGDEADAHLGLGLEVVRRRRPRSTPRPDRTSPPGWGPSGRPRPCRGARRSGRCPRTASAPPRRLRHLDDGRVGAQVELRLAQERRPAAHPAERVHDAVVLGQVPGVGPAPRSCRRPGRRARCRPARCSGPAGCVRPAAAREGRRAGHRHERGAAPTDQTSAPRGSRSRPPRASPPPRSRPAGARRAAIRSAGTPSSRELLAHGPRPGSARRSGRRTRPLAAQQPLHAPPRPRSPCVATTTYGRRDRARGRQVALRQHALGVRERIGVGHAGRTRDTRQPVAAPSSASAWAMGVVPTTHSDGAGRCGST